MNNIFRFITTSVISLLLIFFLTTGAKIDLTVKIVLALFLALVSLPFYKKKLSLVATSLKSDKNMHYAAVGLSTGLVIGWIVAFYYLFVKCSAQSSGCITQGLIPIIAVIYALPTALVGLVIAFIVKYFKK